MVGCKEKGHVVVEHNGLGRTGEPQARQIDSSIYRSWSKDHVASAMNYQSLATIIPVSSTPLSVGSSGGFGGVEPATLVSTEELPVPAAAAPLLATQTSLLSGASLTGSRRRRSKLKVSRNGFGPVQTLKGSLILLQRQGLRGTGRSGCKVTPLTILSTPCIQSTWKLRFASADSKASLFSHVAHAVVVLC